MKKTRKTAERAPQHLVPYLLYKDVSKALEWLGKAFGFQECGERFTGSDGKIQHAEMEIAPNGEVFMMGSPGRLYQNPKKLGSVTAMMYLTVENVDQHFARAKAAKAKVLEPPTDTFYGHRRYGVTDPEGHQWFFAQPIAASASAEIQKAKKKITKAKKK